MLANAKDTPDIEELAGMLTRGEFPENYDHIIRNISDEDLERLWRLVPVPRSKNEGFRGEAHSLTAVPLQITIDKSPLAKRIVLGRSRVLVAVGSGSRAASNTTRRRSRHQVGIAGVAPRQNRSLSATWNCLASNALFICPKL